MLWIQVAAVLGALGIALGAFGGHALKKRVSDEQLAAFKTGVMYHLVHTPAVLALGLYARATAADVTVPAALLSTGIVLFSGSLYALTFTGVKKLGIITPFGGLAFIAGWIALLVIG